ncbi:hypothetical protein GE061_007393 [Apolygus lucorum]|uniref:Uncharacterized protein n=1 Tax=Apolygus lucorum TaxID=248454 RepID=A0A8S9WRS4_APOLU|nr:hypothetical protein GE061_007393 [Apolygus lucorum]
MLGSIKFERIKLLAQSVGMMIIKIVLLLTLAAICSSKRLNSKQIKFFKNNVESWKAPGIEKVLGGKSEFHRKASSRTNVNRQRKKEKKSDQAEIG